MINPAARSNREAQVIAGRLPHVAIYLGEIASQCRYGLDAALAVEHALRDLPSGKVKNREVFRNLHSLLTHASNVSRLLWPSPRRAHAAVANARATELRKLLLLPDSGHPLHSRTLRDHLEHFDERLDDWTCTTRQHNFAQDIIAPLGFPFFGQVDLDPGDKMRWFDPVSRKYAFRGDVFELTPLVKALESVHTKSLEMNNRSQSGVPSHSSSDKTGPPPT